MSDKIKRLAQNISELVKKSETPQGTYDNLVELMRKQSDYFRHMQPENVVKLIFYIYSLQTTGNYDLAEKILNKIAFAVVFTSEGNFHMTECLDCGGEGRYDCQLCDGRERVHCEECDGTGEVDCEDCDGTGEVDGEACDECNGSGNVTCPECGGDGEVTCPDCNWGKTDCNSCEGSGEVETGDWDYEEYFIVTWNKFIKDRCELTENDSDVTMSEYDFDRLRGKYIILRQETEHAVFADFVQENEVYCIYYSDNPKLYLGSLDLKLFVDKHDVSTWTAHP